MVMMHPSPPEGKVLPAYIKQTSSDTAHRFENSRKRQKNTEITWTYWRTGLNKEWDEIKKKCKLSASKHVNQEEKVTWDQLAILKVTFLSFWPQSVLTQHTPDLITYTSWDHMLRSNESGFGVAAVILLQSKILTPLWSSYFFFGEMSYGWEPHSAVSSNRTITIKRRGVWFMPRPLTWCCESFIDRRCLHQSETSLPRWQHMVNFWHHKNPN